jgi:hypothetical protein
MSQVRSTAGKTRVSRRAAIQAGAAAGAAGVGLAISVTGPNRLAAQDGAWRTEHLEVDFAPHDPVSITRAGGGPPQRGDWFYIDAPIFAANGVNGVQIGVYQCFGAWTAASDDTEAPTLRLTTVQFRLDEGSIMGLINEFGTEFSVGAVQGGTGSYIGALGTFQQNPAPAPATPEGSAMAPAAATPMPGQSVFRATFDLILPNVGT